VPEPRAIRGIDGVSVAVAAADPTADFLRDLGFDPGATDRGRRRFRATSDRASVVDVSETPGGRLGHGGTGVVHHVAVRAADAPTLRAYREALAERGGRVTAVIDRHYFESVYVREPGGVLFEVATDGPGVTADEPRDALGSSLALPDWLADDRASIEADLPDPYRPSGGATDGRE
jgi:glyoxalase family protein